MEQTNQDKKIEIFAVLGLIFAVLMPLLGLVFSIIGLVRISKNSNKEGKGLAITGLVISIFQLIVVIGAIAYFGVLDPGKLVPTTP